MPNQLNSNEGEKMKEKTESKERCRELGNQPTRLYERNGKMNCKTKLRVIVECNACCPDTMEIVRADYGDGNDYYIQFRIDSFYAGQSVTGIIKERLRLAWLAIRKGNYIHQEIITTKEALMELRNGLIEMNLEMVRTPQERNK